MVVDVSLKVNVGRHRPVCDEGRVVQGCDERLARRGPILILNVQGDLGRGALAENRAEEQDQDHGEGEGEERPDARAEILATERRDVGKDSLHAASTPSSIRAPTSLRNTSSSVERFV